MVAENTQSDTMNSIFVSNNNFKEHRAICFLVFVLAYDDNLISESRF
jgi:hypothetical protein